MTYKFKATLDEMPDSKVYNRHFKVPSDIRLKLLEDNPNKRILCSVNGNEAYSTGMMPLGEGRYYININKNLCKAYNIDIHDEVELELSKDLSKYGIPVPEEFDVLMDQDPEGTAYFHSLSPGKQRSLLHLLGIPKSSDLRLKKSIVLMNYLKLVKGKLDFKELNESFKESNR